MGTRFKGWRIHYWIFIIGVLFVTLFFTFKVPSSSDHFEYNLEQALLLSEKEGSVVFEDQVKPILERRCVVCHGCYDAPCQLKLSSPEGLMRGASEERIYDRKRLVNMEPTRLFIDEKTTEGWRERGFTSVLNEGEDTPENNLKNSVLYHLLNLKKQYPQPKEGLLPESFTLALNREQSCATIDTVEEFSEEHPSWGMPYAMPNLSDKSHQTLVSWLAQGAVTPAPPQPSTKALPQIESWETFLNQTSNKHRLVSRYLYEHLFHAHIQFSETEPREFFRLVRSSTPPGQPVNEIATIKPYDPPTSDPSIPFYYRFIKYHPTIVVKSHIVYKLSPQRMQRYQTLFFTGDYEVSQRPTYEPKRSANPFKTFEEIPVKARYRFLLDDAYFFIQGFVKGPVCRGQVALDVIEDRFWLVFFDPDKPLITNSPQFLGRMADVLQVPADNNSHLELLRIWTEYWKGLKQYMEQKQAWFKTIGVHQLDHAIDTIWDGDGHNPNAALTVFRHFDSASVAYGLVGDAPETAWVIDYPLLERIHYLLVAGFNVYGNISHQLSTRIYMDFLRMEGEDYFLAFLPVDKRKAIRDSWYLGQRQTIEELFSAPQAWLSTKSVIGYQTNDPQAELYQRIQAHLSPVATAAFSLNKCDDFSCNQTNVALNKQVDRKKVDRAMAQIAQLKGVQLAPFPDIAFVRIKTSQPEKDFAYSLIRNKAYKNVTSFLADEHERNRADIKNDSMTVLPWLEGAYPNFFFSVAQEEVDAFVAHCATIRTEKDYQRFVEKYGVRRTNSEFWALADWFQDEFAKRNPVTSGLFDLNRYQNR